MQFDKFPNVKTRQESQPKLLHVSTFMQVEHDMKETMVILNIAIFIFTTFSEVPTFAKLYWQMEWRLSSSKHKQVSCWEKGIEQSSDPSQNVDRQFLHVKLMHMLSMFMWRPPQILYFKNSNKEKNFDRWHQRRLVGYLKTLSTQRPTLFFNFTPILFERLKVTK